MLKKKSPDTLASAARTELAARRLDDAVIADCIRACTRIEDGHRLPRRVLMQALRRLYHVVPGHRQLDAAIAVVHRGAVSLGEMGRPDRRRAFVGLGLKPTPEVPQSVYAIWHSRLKGEGLTIGRVQQIIDLHKVARGENAADLALRYLRANDWRAWPPDDRRIWELYYVDGYTLRGIARELGNREKSFVGSRLAIHQHRAGVPSSGTIDNPTRLPYVEPEDVEITAQPTGGSRPGACNLADDFTMLRNETERGGGFAIRQFNEDE